MQTWRVTLACRHVVEFGVSPPMKGEHIWCVRCLQMRVVTSAPTEYRIRCKRCTYGRMFGDARLNAEMAATKHRQKTGHRVSIYNGKQLIYTIGERDAEQDTPLPIGDDAPPF